MSSDSGSDDYRATRRSPPPLRQSDDYRAMSRSPPPRRQSESDEERHRSSSGSSMTRSSSSSDSSSDSRSRSRDRRRRRSRIRNQRRSRSRSRSRSHAAAADVDEFTVRIDNQEDLFNCTFCHRLLSSPVYECGDGHLTCHRCHDSNIMACYSCGSKDYARSRAVGRMVRSVRFACRNREHGCAALLPRHGVEEHERGCRYEPCFCPEPDCQRAFLPDALEHHLTDRHGWRLRYGEEVAVVVNRQALLRADDGKLFHLWSARREDTTALSVIRMRPDNAPEADAEFSYEVKPPGAAWRMHAAVWSTSLRRGMEDGSRVSVTVPDDGLRMVNVCVSRLPARSCLRS